MLSGSARSRAAALAYTPSNNPKICTNSVFWNGGSGPARITCGHARNIASGGRRPPATSRRDTAITVCTWAAVGWCITQASRGFLAMRTGRGGILSRFANGHPVRIVHHAQSPYFAGRDCRRARSRLGENDYRLLTNNCEHFCNWCVSGVNIRHSSGTAVAGCRSSAWRAASRPDRCGAFCSFCCRPRSNSPFAYARTSH